MRKLSRLDSVISGADHFLMSIWGKPKGTGESSPAALIDDADLSEDEKKKSIALMRVNHTGEVCAQALYQSQSLYSQSKKIKKEMIESAIEENNHLIWCAERIEQLGGKTSVLNPIFYIHSFMVGAIVGSFGDQYSLGFIVETEKQVENHLSEYIKKLPQQDKKSSVILEKMREDEIHHGNKAQNHGAAELPKAVRLLMRLTSKVMTKTTYFI